MNFEGSKILFLGDICADSFEFEDVEKFKQTKLYDFLKNYDGVIVGNLEAPILRKNIIVNSNKFSLLNSPDVKEFFNFCNVVTIANNHIFDQGYEGYSSTIDWLKKHNILYCGAGDNIKNARKPVVFNVENNTIALLAYNCYSTNSQHNAEASSFGTSPLIFDYIEEDIKETKKQYGNNVRIFILPHWGIENEFSPTAEQVVFSRHLSDLGISGIISTHTHTIQVDERFNNVPIYYSLGNFLFNNFKLPGGQKYYQHKYNKEGCIVEFEFGDDGSVANREYYIQLGDDMIPELASIDGLQTPIIKNRDEFNSISSKINYKQCEKDLSLELKFNGRSMQVVYGDSVLKKNFSLKKASFSSKIKRLVIHKLRRLL